MNNPRSVLFVDDEPMVLSGLRRSMHGLRNEWRCDFAGSGEEALRKMAQGPFDVVVSDMMMPAMNGAELLQQIRDRHPATVRIILSGQADKTLVAQCLDCTHRFLDKPCEPTTLKATLEYATSIVFALREPAMAALVGRIRRLPSPPKICEELDRRLRSSLCSVEEIGDLIGRDVAMTAQVLKVVNSAYFGLGREIESAHEAVTYLGIEMIRSLAVFSDLTAQMIKLGVTASWVESLWRHSLRVSAGARCIAELEGASRRVVKESATAGLLHDTGKLILALNFPARTARTEQAAVARGVGVAEVEREDLGCTHADVGGYLFALWGLSLPVVQGVAWHHAPVRQDPPVFSPTMAVHAADVFAHEYFKESEGGAVPALDTDYLQKVGLLAAVPRWREAVERVWADSGR